MVSGRCELPRQNCSDILQRPYSDERECQWPIDRAQSFVCGVAVVHSQCQELVCAHDTQEPIGFDSEPSVAGSNPVPAIFQMRAIPSRLMNPGKVRGFFMRALRRLRVPAIPGVRVLRRFVGWRFIGLAPGTFPPVLVPGWFEDCGESAARGLDQPAAQSSQTSSAGWPIVILSPVTLVRGPATYDTRRATNVPPCDV